MTVIGSVVPFYLNVVGYKDAKIVPYITLKTEFYLNVVGYKVRKLDGNKYFRIMFYLNVVGYKVYYGKSIVFTIFRFI